MRPDISESPRYVQVTWKIGVDISCGKRGWLFSRARISKFFSPSEGGLGVLLGGFGQKEGLWKPRLGVDHFINPENHVDSSLAYFSFNVQVSIC